MQLSHCALEKFEQKQKVYVSIHCIVADRRPLSDLVTCFMRNILFNYYFETDKISIIRKFFSRI